MLGKPKCFGGLVTKNISNESKENMTTIIVGLGALVAGFVFGVLFGRRNPKKVNAAVNEVNAVVGSTAPKAPATGSK